MLSYFFLLFTIKTMKASQVLIPIIEAIIINVFSFNFINFNYYQMLLVKGLTLEIIKY